MVLSAFAFAGLALRRAGFPIKAREGSARLFRYYPTIRRDFKTGLRKPETPRLARIAAGDGANLRCQGNGEHHMSISNRCPKFGMFFEIF